jgi:hypothetical protein
VKNLNRLTVGLALIVFSFVTEIPAFAVNSDSSFRFDFSARYRFEAWNGMNARFYGNPKTGAIGNPDDKLLYQRFITGFTWMPSNQVTIAAHLQDSRAFGWSLRNSQFPDLFRVGGTTADVPTYRMNPGEEYLEIYDLFVEYRNFLPNTTAKLGRQKIFFGDNHIFGPGDWGNTGRWTWDALLLTWKKDKHSIDMFGGGVKVHDPQVLAIPFTFTEYRGGGVYGHFEVNNSVAVEPFYALKVQGSADYIRLQEINRNWWGIRLFNIQKNGMILDGTIARQFGRQNVNPIDAWGIFAKAGYQFLSVWSKPIVSLRESYATGGKMIDQVIHTFDPAYGASDKYYGWMNIVSWSNLDNREINLEFFPGKGKWIEIKFNRYLIAEPEGINILGALKLTEGEHHLGDEFNIFARWQQNNHWQWVGVLGFFRPGKVQLIGDKPAESATWMAFQLQYTL